MLMLSIIISQMSVVYTILIPHKHTHTNSMRHRRLHFVSHLPAFYTFSFFLGRITRLLHVNTKKPILFLFGWKVNHFYRFWLPVTININTGETRSKATEKKREKSCCRFYKLLVSFVCRFDSIVFDNFDYFIGEFTSRFI